MKLTIKIICVCALLLIGVSFFNYTPTFDGVDLSHHNRIEHHSEKIANVAFMIAKATEGSDWVDPTYKKHKKYATKHDIKFGAYHFLSKTSPISDQFNLFRKTVGKDIDIIPCVDIEKTAGKHWSRRQARKAIKEWSDSCLSYYGRYPIIYCNDYYRIFYFLDMPNPFWISNWHTRPLTNCVIHQYTSNDETLDYNHLMTDLTNILL